MTHIPSILDLVTYRNAEPGVRMAAIAHSNSIPDGEVRMLGNLLLEKSGGRWTEYVFTPLGDFAKGQGDERTADMLIKWMEEQPSMTKEVYHSMGPAMPATMTQRGAIHKALVRRIAKGEYTHAASMRLWRKAVTCAAKAWAGPAISPVTRDLAASKLADGFLAKARQGQYDHHLAKESPVRSLMVKSESEDSSTMAKSLAKAYRLMTMKEAAEYEHTGKFPKSWTQDIEYEDPEYDDVKDWEKHKAKQNTPAAIARKKKEAAADRARWAKEIDRAAPMPKDLGIGKPVQGWGWEGDASSAPGMGYDIGYFKRKHEHGWVWIEALESKRGSKGPFLVSTGKEPGGSAKRYKGPAGGDFTEAMAYVDAASSRGDAKVATEDKARAGGAKPPGSGWQSIPRGKKGGYRRKAADGWEYWYPGSGVRKSSLELDDAIDQFQKAEFPEMRMGSVTYPQRAADPLPPERSAPGLRPRQNPAPVSLRDDTRSTVVRSGPEGRLIDPRSGLLRRK